MKLPKVLVIVFGVISLSSIGYFSYQKFVVNKGMIVDLIVPSIADEKEVFEVSDPSVEETLKYPLEVIAVKPNVENVSDVSQISITFNKPMVPLGDFEKSAQNLPIEINPKVNCQWRWLNRMTLSCQLNEPLPFSNHYEILISKMFKAFDGTQLENDVIESFSTLKWKVEQSNSEWKDADLPMYFWTFNQKMNIDSIQKNIESDCGFIKVNQISKELSERYNIDPERSYSLSFNKKIGLSKDCKIKLNAKALSLYGPEPGVEFNESFQTYSQFKITKINCQSYISTDKPKGSVFKIEGCDPDASISIELSAPVFSKNLVDKIKVQPFFGWSKGGQGSPEYFKQNPEELKTRIYLNGPLNGNDTHTIELLDIKDQFNRNLKGPHKIIISTTDFNPFLNVSDSFGILERNIPHQVAYTAVNYKKFNFKYHHSNSLDDLDMWKYFKKQYDYCRKKLNAKEFNFKSIDVETNAKLNIPVLNPIDIDKLIPDFRYGMILGNVNSPEVLSEELSESPIINEFCNNFFLVVTDLGITSKIGYYDSGVWIHSISKGKPLSNVKVQFRDYNNVLAEGVTNKEGFIKLAGAIEWDFERNKYREWGRDNELFVVAQTDDDMSLLPFYKGTQGISPYSFSDYDANIYFDTTELSKSRNHIVHAITDRPLYQPGQEVKVKLFARHWEPRTFGLSPAEDVEIVVTDSKGKEILKENVKLSDYGTAHTKLKLDPSASLGSYSIIASIGTVWSTSVGSFDVQEFTLPSFKVNVDSIKTRFFVGKTAAFRTTAQYHFGGGLANTKGSYSTAFQEQNWIPTLPKWKSYSFDDQVSLNISGYDRPKSTSSIVLEDGELKTNNEGEAYKQILLSPNQIRTYGSVTFESKFQDDKGKTISKNTSAKVYYTDFQIGLKKDQWAYEAGKVIKPNVILLSPEENPIVGQKFTLKLVHRKYQTVRVKGTGKYFGYETRTLDNVIDECSAISKVDGESCELKSKAAGLHYIIAESIDSKKRLSLASLKLYVTGSEYIGWYREDHDRIDIVPDKETYNLGDEISLLVKSPYDEVEGIVTLERFGILKQFRHKFIGGVETLKIPIDSKDYAPGFYVSVHLIKGRVSGKIEGGVDLGKPSFKMGLAKIKVVNSDTVLNVSANTDKSEYEPGSEVTAQIEVSTATGGKQTEISIAVVDEKILQLAGNYQNKFNLHDKFYEIPGVEVITSQMLSFLIGRRHFGRKGAPEGGDGDGIGLRKNFLPLAYWNPALETDSSGRAKIKFKVPDNLTSWRVLVVSVDKEHRFGFGSYLFKTNKKIMIEPALPSFLTEGDSFKGRMSVFNRTGKDGTIKGGISVEGLDLLSPIDSELNVPNDGKGFLEWMMKTPFDSKNAVIQVFANHTKTGDGDRAQYEIPIRPFVSYETFANYGSTIKSDLSVPVEIPSGIRTDLGGLELIYSPSLIAHLDDVFLYGINYPYGCWEQKLVKSLMLSSYINLRDYISIPEIKHDPKDWINELLNEMSNFQASNGGMSYWKNELRTVDPYLSVFTALGLLWLNQSKVAIPEMSSNRVFEYTKNLLSGNETFPSWYTKNSMNTVLAMAIYVRSLLGDNLTSEINRLYQDKDTLSLFGKSFLWSAASKNKSSQNISNELKKIIFSMADLTSGQIQFQESHDDGFQRILHSTTRTNCQLLVSLLEQDSNGSFIEPLVRWVIGTRKANRWNNTQENIFCLNALSNYAKIYEKEKPNFNISTHAFGKTIDKVNISDFKQKPIVQNLSFVEAGSDLKQDIKINKNGNGRLYYTTKLKVAYKDVRQTPVNSGMQVQRNYYLKNASGKWEHQDGVINVKRGDLVKIELKVSVPAVRYHVALADSLPAGLEPLNTALASTSTSDTRDESDDSSGSYHWNEDDSWWGFYSSGGFYHKEIRLFGAQYFADFLSKGDYKISYIAQAIAVGEFNVSPALIEQMYEPEVYGKSTPSKFIIKE